MKAKTLALGLAALTFVGFSMSAETRKMTNLTTAASVPKTQIRKMTNLTTAAGSTIVIGRAATTLATAKTAATTSLNRTTLATSKAAATLASGATTIFLGPTGGGGATTTLSGVSGDTLVVSAGRPGGTTLTSANSLGTSIEAQVFRSDLPRITPRANDLTVGNGLSLGSNAASSGAAPAPVSIGPNGFPVFADVTIPALATIGPNGFITTAPATAVTTTASPIPIGSNGFPDPNAAPTTQTGLTIGGAATVPVTQTSTASRAAAGALSTAPTAASSMSAPAPSTGAAASSPK